jgi:uncharacterized membrane protein HdeD (DUF308 family)
MVSRIAARMARVRRVLESDDLYELMIMVWIVAGPLAIAGWVQQLPEPAAWAAFISGVIGVLVGWLVVAPYRARRD